MDRNNKIKMRGLIISIGAIVSIFFQGCNNNKIPYPSDFIGVWKSVDKTEFTFRKDGTFNLTFFPVDLVLLPKSNYANQRFNGSGTWVLRKGKVNWEIYLDFTQVSDKKYSSAFPLLIGGGSGILENNPPWYIFLWKEEEGGERIKYFKK